MYLSKSNNQSKQLKSKPVSKKSLSSVPKPVQTRRMKKQVVENEPKLENENIAHEANLPLVEKVQNDRK